MEPVASYHVDVEHAALLDDRPTVAAYANEVAVMALVPYARQAVADVTLRVFEASVLMPSFQRGELRFGVADQQPRKRHRCPDGRTVTEVLRHGT